MPNPTPKHPPVKLTKGYIDKVTPGPKDEFHWCVDLHLAAAPRLGAALRALDKD
ncbi:MAG: hypothetical protein Q8P60_06500 [Pseudorhodobacter sp.]|nr:hypothetical protein [Pseudorhodobacter sp.]